MDDIVILPYNLPTLQTISSWNSLSYKCNHQTSTSLPLALHNPHEHHKSNQARIQIPKLHRLLRQARMESQCEQTISGQRLFSYVSHVGRTTRPASESEPESFERPSAHINLWWWKLAKVNFAICLHQVIAWPPCSFFHPCLPRAKQYGHAQRYQGVGGDVERSGDDYLHPKHDNPLLPIQPSHQSRAMICRQRKVECREQSNILSTGESGLTTEKEQWKP